MAEKLCELCMSKKPRDNRKVCDECMGLERDNKPPDQYEKCKVCGKEKPASMMHPRRKGWCIECVGYNLRNSKSSQKLDKQPIENSDAISEQPSDDTPNASTTDTSDHIETIHATKVCDECGMEFKEYKLGSKIKPNCCLDCLKKRQSAAIRKRWLCKFEDEGLLILDLTHIKDMIPSIRDDARENMRTFQAQCLWYLAEKARKLGQK